MRSKYVWAAAVVLLAAAYLIYSGWRGAAVYYLTVGEALERQAQLQGRSFRLTGTVGGSSAKWDPQSGELHFLVTDGQREVPVSYQGPRPDNFTSGQQVVVEGRLDGRGGMVASRLILKCPSKYQQAAPTPGRSAAIYVAIGAVVLATGVAALASRWVGRGSGNRERGG